MSFADDIIEKDETLAERPPSVWSLGYDGFEPEQQGLREALCALGNGYFVTRGALPEAQADGINYPGTYVAGLYNRLPTEIAGRTIENEDLVNLPNWLALSFRVDDGPWFDIQTADVLDHQPGTRPRAGVLTRQLSVAGAGRPPDPHGAAPVRQHEGSAPGRPADHLHGRELVGDAERPVRRGRADHQLRGEALPRPRQPSSHDPVRRGDRRPDRRIAGGDHSVPRPDRGRGPDQAPGRRRPGGRRPAPGR